MSINLDMQDGVKIGLNDLDLDESEIPLVVFFSYLEFKGWTMLNMLLSEPTEYLDLIFMYWCI